MADANGVPRRVSMAYILGFSNKPYKEVRLPIPPPPPQARKPSQPVSIIPTPGHIMEWTASDGRKGKLTGAGKPRLTAASLAKVPSDKRSTKEALSVKSTSKKATATKPAVDGGDGWVTNTDWAKTSVKDGNKDSDSKKGNKGPLDNTGNESNDPLANSWGKAGNAAGGDDKTDEKKDETTSAWDTPTNAQTGPEAHDNPVRGSEGDKKDENKNAWTKEQDEKLMHMKAENVNVAWNKISQEFGKTEEDCRKRFKAIKPNAVKQGGEGKKGKEKRQNHDQNQSKGGNKKDAKNNGNKEEEKKDETSWVAEAWDMPGGNGDVFPGLFGGDTDNNKDDSGNKDTSWDDLKEGTTGAGTSEWDTKGGWGSGNMTGGRDGADAAAVKWDSNSGGNWDTASNNDQDKKKDGASIADPWNPTAPLQNSPKQTPSQTGSQHKASSNNNAQPITTRPLELEVKPDDTFSADDLRLVARILQQDRSMVWNRVSWRFRDKTGRTLHPDEFEKKITGRLEGKDCEKSKRR